MIHELTWILFKAREGNITHHIGFFNDLLDSASIRALTQDHQSGNATLSKRAKCTNQHRKILLFIQSANSQYDRWFPWLEPWMLDSRCCIRIESIGNHRIVNNSESLARDASLLRQIICNPMRNSHDQFGRA